MELEQVDVVRPQAAETLLNVGQNGLFVLSGALGGDHHVLADTLKGLAQLLLAVGVGVGGVEVVDAAVHRPADQLHGVGLGNALDGQSAKGGLGDVQFRAAQSDFFHISSS